MTDIVAVLTVLTPGLNESESWSTVTLTSTPSAPVATNDSWSPSGSSNIAEMFNVVVPWTATLSVVATNTGGLFAVTAKKPVGLLAKKIPPTNNNTSAMANGISRAAV